MTHNTHRAEGRARTPRIFRSMTRAGGGMALASAAVFGGMTGANAETLGSTQATANVTVTTVNAGELAGLDLSNILTSSTLRLNARGQGVQMLQVTLNSHGADLKADGKFGARTHRAVKNFQRANGLKADGVVGPKTRRALSSNSAEGVSKRTHRSAGSNSIVAAARSQKGVDYRWGASKPGSGFDCSGFTRYAYKQAGIDLPRTSRAQAYAGTRVSRSEARPGDLVVWPGHVGIYAGNGKVIEASRSRDQIVERTIWGSPRFVTFR